MVHIMLRRPFCMWVNMGWPSLLWCSPLPKAWFMCARQIKTAKYNYGIVFFAFYYYCFVSPAFSWKKIWSSKPPFLAFEVKNLEIEGKSFSPFFQIKGVFYRNWGSFGRIFLFWFLNRQLLIGRKLDKGTWAPINNLMMQ